MSWEGGRGLVTIDYIFTALLYYILQSSLYTLLILGYFDSLFCFQRITPLAKVHTVFKWQNQDSLPVLQTPIHSQSPNYILSHCRRCSVTCCITCHLPLSRLVMGEKEGLFKCLIPSYLLPQPWSKTCLVFQTAGRLSFTQGCLIWEQRASSPWVCGFPEENNFPSN